ncbi:hypothetical protein DPX16_17752 [Anabarilius grahami]|uniref:Uncharacterized protein n=1 Tax=Anabarilius grahami TaxID=495550 RepID=A0A3N0YHA6_ANAGA|nr:hypothetical protein DPX16_17752 [Anabarilius grahami]
MVTIIMRLDHKKEYAAKFAAVAQISHNLLEYMERFCRIAINCGDFSSTSEPQVADSREASAASEARQRKTDDYFSKTQSLERRVLRRKFSPNLQAEAP